MDINFEKLTEEQKKKILEIVNDKKSPIQMETSDINQFIDSVVNKHIYTAKYIAPIAIDEQYIAHSIFDKEIDKLNGCVINPDDWDDRKAVYALMEADPFTDNDGYYTDKKLEVIAYFFDGQGGWGRIYKILKALGWTDRVSLNDAVNDIYKCLCDLEKDWENLDNNVKFALQNFEGPKYNKHIEKYCGFSSCFRCGITYYDTSFELEIEFVFGTESSRSWEWKPVETKLLEFNTDAFWNELDEEISAYRKAWLDEDENSLEVFASDNKFFLLNDPDQKYKQYHTIIRAIASFFTFNDSDCEINSFMIFAEAIEPYYSSKMFWPQTTWYGKSRYFTYGNSQYYVSVDRDYDDKYDTDIHIIIICLDHNYRQYVSCVKESCY